MTKILNVTTDTRPSKAGSIDEQTVYTELHTTGQILKAMADSFYTAARMIPDTGYRCARVALLLEEVAELSTALAQKDDEAVLDALADIHFVNYGNAVQWGYSLDDAFWRVAESNMTKNQGASKDGSDPANGKGPGYEAPSLEGLL